MLTKFLFFLIVLYSTIFLYHNVLGEKSISLDERSHSLEKEVDVEPVGMPGGWVEQDVHDKDVQKAAQVKQKIN